QKRSESTMTDEEKRQLEEQQRAAVEAARSAGESAATERIADIFSVINDFQDNVPGLNLREKAEAYVKDPQKTGQQFYREVVKPALKDPKATGTPATQVGLSEKETRDYSITNMILFQLGKVAREKVG